MNYGWIQLAFILVGSILIGHEFGVRVGVAVGCFGYALMPISIA